MEVSYNTHQKLSIVLTNNMHDETEVKNELVLGFANREENMLKFLERRSGSVVEQLHGKEQAAGPIPAFGSK